MSLYCATSDISINSNHTEQQQSTTPPKLQSQQQPLDKICHECQAQPFLYQCPRCSFRSCSLACCVAHKRRTGCTGKRDRTPTFLPIHSMNDTSLRSDYHFLEDIVGELDGAQREFDQANQKKKKPRRNHSNDLPPAQQQHPLLQAATPSSIPPKFNLPSSTTTTLCRNRKHLQSTARQHYGIHLLFLPPFMERHQQNKSRVGPKNSSHRQSNTPIITWTVEWCLHTSTPPERRRTQLDDHAHIWDHVREHVLSSSTQFLLRFQPHPAPVHQRRYVDIPTTTTSCLAQVLSHSTLVEFPTLHIVPIQAQSDFPLLVETVADSSSTDSSSSDDTTGADGS